MDVKKPTVSSRLTSNQIRKNMFVVQYQNINDVCRYWKTGYKYNTFFCAEEFLFQGELTIFVAYYYV